ncbi:unnamed protein product [Orchesella dallaii]|uniref:Uncharacterized protein n=1 Tax=Orchesella dallaii TaxID=48710 RepID=A0ABP1S889_9HEXA
MSASYSESNPLLSCAPLLFIIFLLLIILRCLRFWAIFEESQHQAEAMRQNYQGSFVGMNVERNRSEVSIPTVPYLIVLPPWGSTSYSRSEVIEGPPPKYQPPPSYSECVNNDS